MFYYKSVKHLKKTDYLENINFNEGLLDSKNTLIFCTSEQTDFDIIKTIFLISHQNKKLYKKINTKKGVEPPHKARKIESKPEHNIINVYFVLPSTFAI